MSVLNCLETWIRTVASLHFSSPDNAPSLQVFHLVFSCVLKAVLSPCITAPALDVCIRCSFCNASVLDIIIAQWCLHVAFCCQGLHHLDTSSFALGKFLLLIFISFHFRHFVCLFGYGSIMTVDIVSVELRKLSAYSLAPATSCCSFSLGS